MKVGFTGTQKGATEAQKSFLKSFLRHDGSDLRHKEEFHHGDCVGSDEQAHEIAHAVGYRTYAHPPSNPSKRAYCAADVIHDPLPYIQRNHVIMESTDVLVATPEDHVERLRSGTWATIRHARKMKKMIAIVFPSGTVKKENWS